MGNSYRKARSFNMKIYEFSGLPGAGKSTLCEAVIKELEAQGKSVLTLRQLKKYKHGKKVELVKALFFVPNLRFNIHAFTYAISIGGTKQMLQHSAGLILLYYRLRLAIKEDRYDYCILEEALIQYFTSIPHDKVMGENSHLNKMLEFVLKNTGTVNDIACNISNEEVLARLRHRNHIETSRFDGQADDRKLMELLQVKGKNITYIRKRISQSFFVEMEDVLEANTEKIMDYLGAGRE